MLTDKEEFFKELRAKLQAARLVEQQRHAHAVAHGIDFKDERRSENLRLLRAYFDTTQERFAQLLRVSSQSQYSSFERGLKVLPSEDARTIERSLGLPENWLDRSNAPMLFVTTDQLAVLKEVQKAPAEAAIPLAKAVKSMTGLSGQS